MQMHAVIQLYPIIQPSTCLHKIVALSCFPDAFQNILKCLFFSFLFFTSAYRVYFLSSKLVIQSGGLFVKCAERLTATSWILLFVLKTKWSNNKCDRCVFGVSNLASFQDSMNRVRVSRPEENLHLLSPQKPSLHALTPKGLSLQVRLGTEKVCRKQGFTQMHKAHTHFKKCQALIFFFNLYYSKHLSLSQTKNDLTFSINIFVSEHGYFYLFTSQNFSEISFREFSKVSRVVNTNCIRPIQKDT